MQCINDVNNCPFWVGFFILEATAIIFNVNYLARVLKKNNN